MRQSYETPFRTARTQTLIFFRARLRKTYRVDMKTDGKMKKYKKTEKERTQRKTVRKTRNKAQCSYSVV